METIHDTVSNQKLTTNEAIIVLIFIVLFGVFVFIFNDEYTKRPTRSELRFMHELHTTMYDCGDNCDFPTIEF